jgi:UDP-N-acetylmuramyl pentapeptide phosphotransferase/UDP-N-acetylglucosamine-1-phosphate transferase
VTPDKPGEPVKDYVLTLLAAAAVTYVLTPLVRRFAIAVGAIKERARERDVHTAPVPSLGGLAMYAGLAAGLLVANEISQLHDAIAGTGMVTGLLGAGGLVVIIGFIDDRWGMSALTKAAGQVAAGGILVATGAQLSWLPLPGGSGRIFIPTPDQETLLTILIVVATINAVNFIDGLDGLAAGIVAIAAVSFYAYYYSLTRLVDIFDQPVPRAHAAAAARGAARHPVRGHAARGCAPDQGGTVTVRGRPQTLASPAAGHRALAARQRADHVPVGGGILWHRGLAVDRED